MASTTELVTSSVADLAEKPPKRTFKELNWSEKVKYVGHLITVEPLIACYLAAAVLAVPAMQNLELEKACRANKEYNDTICDAILGGYHENYTAENEAVQIVITDMHSWQNPIQQIMPFILILFLGAYSDRHKIRKPFLLIPIFGEFFALVGCILCVVFLRQWPVEALGFFQTVLPSFFGSYIMIVMAAYSYIADVSDNETRTLRVGIVQIVLNATAVVVNPISGLLFAALGYIGVLIVVGVLFVIAIIYGIFCIKEPKISTQHKKNLLVDVFDPRHAINTLSLLVKKTPRNKLVILWIVLAMNMIYCLINQGEFSLLFLFTQSAFQWTPVEFSFYATMNFVVHLIGVAVGVPLFTKFFHFGDSVILILTFLDKIVSNVMLGFVKTGTMFYVGTVVSIITGLAVVPLRSLLTKVVTEDSVSRALSLYAISESVGTAIGVPLYNQAIYNQTISTFPSAFFLFGAALNILLIIMTLYVYIKQKKETIPVTNGKTSNDEFQNGKGEYYTQTTHM